MKKALMIVSVLLIAVVSTACINNMAVQELNNKAAEYMQKGDYEAAMSRLQSSIDLDSTLYETYYNLGVAAISAEKFEKAIEALENGIKINPDYPEFYYSLGIAQSSLADELLNDDKDEDSKDKVKEEDKNDENQTEIFELKQASILNLKKYLELSPSTKDKESVEALINEIQTFLNGEKKEVITKVVE